jgi:WD40 repeat protein
MIYDVAISYAKEEVARLEETVAVLERAGLSVWTDRGLLPVGRTEQAERLVPAGVEHWEAIREGIDRSATFVFLDSPRWRSSEYCRKECRHAIQRGIRTIESGAASSGEVDASARVAEGDAAGMIAAVREGLEVSRAHARVRLLTVEDGVGATEVAPDDVTVLAEANLGELGMFLPPAMARGMDEALELARRRRLRLATLLAVAVTVAALLAAVGLFAWIAARKDEERASSAARHVESLALATASGSSANTFARLDLARRAIDLEQNPTTVTALREAVDGFGKGVSIHLDEVEPLGLAVANDGDVVAVQHSGGLSLISAHGGEVQREVSPEAAGAVPVLAFAPAGRKLAVVRSEGGSVEIVDFRTGRLVRVGGTTEIAAVFFISDRRGIAVSHEGEVLEFDPEGPHPRAKRVQWVLGPVRAAALTDVGSDGKFSLATLVDGAVEVTEVGAAAAPWRAPLPLPQDPFSPGRESVTVCGGDLAVLATGRAEGLSFGFGIPYTIDPAGNVDQAGSLHATGGSICLPEGGALAIDPLSGQHPFPEGGAILPNLIDPPTEVASYALASSENGQWAGVSGPRGTLKVVELEGSARAQEMQQVETVAAGEPNGTAVVVGAREVQGVSFQGDGVADIETGVGEAARGAYFDPELGTVLAVGEELLVVRDGRVRGSRPVGTPIYAVHPGQPGASALVIPAYTRNAFDVPLQGGRKTSVELPGDVHAGATQLSDAIELPGRSHRLVTAASDGYLDLLAYPSGREVRRRRVAPPGPLSLAVAGDGQLLASGSDGLVRLVDSRTLAVERERRVLPAAPSLVVTSPSAKFAAVFSPDDVAAVLALPSLDPVSRIGPIDALNSVAFSGDRTLLLGADLHWITGGDEASVTSWPLCAPCAGDAERLRGMAASLVEPRPAGERSSFVPEPAEEIEDEGGDGATVTTAGVGGLRLGATAADLRERHLIGKLGPGCVFASGQRIAHLLPPLRGTAVFEDPGVRLSSIVLTGGAVSSRGVEVGDSAGEMLAAYPQAEFEPADPNAPFPFGFLRVRRGQEVLMTMLVDPDSQRVIEIDVPNPAFCE